MISAGHRRRRPIGMLTAALAGWLLGFGPAGGTGVCAAGRAGGLQFPAGGKDAVVISAPDGRIAFSANAETPLVPASTLKLLTALVAINALGPDYRFPTDFTTTADDRLVVKGYGDPLFISEVMDDAAAGLAERLPPDRRPCLSGILLDDRYFAQPLDIPGVSASDNPYDAPNGALCANFNTVFFTRDPVDGQIESAEPQTPLLPFAKERIARSAGAGDRVVLSHRENDPARYTGHLLRFFLESHGCKVAGDVGLLPGPPPPARLFWRFTSPYPLSAIIQQMMAFSNNFMANQLLIAAAAAVYGPPGTLEHGARLARVFASEKLGLTRITIVEGSGISRDNRISAADMHRVLMAFAPYRPLLRQDGDDAFKTGTLEGIRTRVGYLTADGKSYGYVVMLNSDAQRMAAVMGAVKHVIAGLSNAAAAR